MAILRNTTVNDTGFLQLPVGTTGQRPSVSNGRLRFNSTTGKVEFYNTSVAAWLGTAAAGVVATGGVVYDTDVEGTTYRVHVFTATGNSTFAVTRGGPVEYLMAAGGGGGGQNAGAGGGAGGLLTGTTTVTPQAYTISVGAGGAGGTTSLCGTTGANGGNSSAFGFTSIGGGGGTNSGGNGANGGSGGGGGDCSGFSTSDANRFGGNGTSGQGNAGGNGNHPGGGDRTGGGGGGAGGPGQGSVSTAQAGNGGIGLVSFLNGIQTFYAGGGGGAVHNGTDGTGGFGGGANGSSTVSIKTGTPNTGGGGGAGRSPTAGAAGGSGIVIVRYPLRQENPITAAGKVIGDGLVLDLDFAKPTVYSGSGTVVNDSRLNGITGTLVNGPVFTDPRTHRSSFNFDGVDDYIQLPTTTLLRASSTISSWINVDDFTTGKSSTGRVFIRRTGFNFFSLVAFYNGGYSFEVDTNSNPHEVAGRTTGNVSSSAITAGSWFHFSLVFDANTFYGYVNGVQTGTAALSNNLIFDRVGDGSGFPNNYPAYFKGNIANTSIYNRALTATEISQNYNATRWRFGV